MSEVCDTFITQITKQALGQTLVSFRLVCFVSVSPNDACSYLPLAESQVPCELVQHVVPVLTGVRMVDDLGWISYINITREITLCPDDMRQPATRPLHPRL